MTGASEEVDHLVREEALCNIPVSGYAQAVCGDQLPPFCEPGWDKIDDTVGWVGVAGLPL